MQGVAGARISLSPPQERVRRYEIDILKARKRCGETGGMMSQYIYIYIYTENAVLERSHTCTDTQYVRSSMEKENGPMVQCCFSRFGLFGLRSA
jgi:hypothetical protein